jgi:hypothetical protein
MKLNLKTGLKNLAGEPLVVGEEVYTLGQALSNITMLAEEGNKMKLFILAQKFFEQDSIELDASDLVLVKKVVANSKAYPGVLVLGQCALLLEGLEEIKE